MDSRCSCVWDEVTSHASCNAHPGQVERFGASTPNEVQGGYLEDQGTRAGAASSRPLPGDPGQPPSHSLCRQHSPVLRHPSEHLPRVDPAVPEGRPDGAARSPPPTRHNPFPDSVGGHRSPPRNPRGSGEGRAWDQLLPPAVSQRLRFVIHRPSHPHEAQNETELEDAVPPRSALPPRHQDPGGKPAGGRESSSQAAHQPGREEQ